jgi:prolyl-tRNA synthetase
MAAIVETHHDDAGMVWPMCVAPFEVVLTVVKVDHEGSMAVAEAAHNNLLAAGIDVLLDDRDGRPGVKFADSELIGIPLRVTIGPRGIDSEMLELTVRATGEQEDLPVGDLVSRVVELVHEGRSARL